MRKVTVAATQMKSRGFDREANIQAAEALIREAAGKGANIILIQELFQTDYFCQKMIDQNMKLALPLEEDPASEPAFPLLPQPVINAAAHITLIATANNLLFLIFVLISALHLFFYNIFIDLFSLKASLPDRFLSKSPLYSASYPAVHKI